MSLSGKKSAYGASEQAWYSQVQNALSIAQDIPWEEGNSNILHSYTLKHENATAYS